MGRNSNFLNSTMLNRPIHSPREGQIGTRAPEFEIDEIVLARRARNAFGKLSLARVDARRVVRGISNIYDYTVCQIVHYLTCGFCCARCAADSINEHYLYTVQYMDSENPGVDKDFEFDLLQKYHSVAEVKAETAFCVDVGPSEPSNEIDAIAVQLRTC